MKDIIVIGAGGHAKVCIELLRAMGEPVAYCVAGHDAADLCLGVPVLKGDSHLVRLAQEGYSRLFVAIGANKLRSKLAIDAQALGYTLCNAVSPAAVISPSAIIAAGVAVMAGAVINAEASIGELAIINTGASIDHDCKIGRAVHIAPQSALAGNVTVGDYAFLGIGTKVIPDITIGEDTIAGAGSGVVRNLLPRTKVIGVPAKIR